jgi:hypothetical protein
MLLKSVPVNGEVGLVLRRFVPFHLTIDDIGAAEGMRGVVITSGVAYGDGGGGVPGVLLGSPRDDDGNLIMLGSGQQHWDTVHAADLAEVFRRVLEDD